MYSIDGIEYKIIDSFYRTIGANYQRLIRVSQVDSFNIESLYKDKLFHIAIDNDGGYVFIKEYLTHKEISKDEFELTILSGQINNNIIKTIGYEDGKIVYEFFDGIPLAALKNIPLKRIYEINMEVYNFLLLCIENNLSHLFELHPNNILISTNPPYDYKIIDFESDPERYKEFYNKNKKYITMYKTVCDTLKKELDK